MFNEFKKSFMNIQFIITLIVTVASLFIYIFADIEFLLYIFLLGLIIIILFIVGFIRNILMKKNVNKIKNGELKYKPYFVTKDIFIDECRSGLMYSIIRIDDVIYEIETQLDEVNSTNYDKFICYINNNEIIGIDSFLNYKYDGVHSLNDLEKIEFLEYNNADPEKYFVERNI